MMMMIDGDVAADGGAECDCSDRGTTSQVCNEETGECLCDDSFTGPRCDRCATGFYRFPQCRRTFLHLSLSVSLVLSPLTSNRHRRSSDNCLEGKGENYEVCSVQHCVQQLCTVQCTHI